MAYKEPNENPKVTQWNEELHRIATEGFRSRLNWRRQRQASRAINDAPKEIVHARSQWRCEDE